MKTKKWMIWVSRFLIFIVLFFNLQAAFEFIFHPQSYVTSFEVSGVPGNNLVSGMGILFLMWNIPYIFAVYHPLKNRISLIEAILMQATGVVGESILFYLLPQGHESLVNTVTRFVLFDGSGLVFLILALIISRPIYKIYRLQG